MQICEEMVKLRKMLDAKGIVWIDKTCVTPDEVISKMKELMPDCINNGEPVGYMTADEVLQLVLKEGGE